MHNKPLVSVILPTYNRAHLIEKSIQSVLQQTFINFELLIIDDGSTDDTEAVVGNINDSRIKYIKCIENKGVSSARNIGIKNAEGEYIAFQDSDIEWYPNKLEVHMGAFKTASPDVGVVYAGHYRVKDNKKVLYIPIEKYAHMNGNIHHVFLETCIVGTPAVCVKKNCFELVGGFDETLSTSEDWELFIRLSKEFKFMYIDESLYDSYYTENSLSSDMNERSKAFEMISEKHKNDYIKNKKKLSIPYYSMGSWFCENGDFYKGRKYLFKSIQANPYNLKYYVKYIISIFGKRSYKTVLKTFRELKKRPNERID